MTFDGSRIDSPMNRASRVPPAGARGGAAAAARAPVGVEEESLALLRVARDVRAPLLGGGGPRLRREPRRQRDGRGAGRAIAARTSSGAGRIGGRSGFGISFL